jgi:hypothetical protein
MAKQNGEPTGGNKHIRQTLRPVSGGKQCSTFLSRATYDAVGSLGPLITASMRSIITVVMFLMAVPRTLSPQPRNASGEATLYHTNRNGICLIRAPPMSEKWLRQRDDVHI